MLVSLLHLCDSLFPIGSFAYSEGLESAIGAGMVKDVADLRDWLDVCLDEVIARSDGPGVAIAWSACHAGDWDTLIAVDEELTALRPSSTIRMANRSMGLRLLKTWQAIHPDARLDGLTDGLTLPAAFGVVCASAGIDRRDGVTGYAYTRLAATVSAAMRLMALGQTDAHRLLGRILERVPATVDNVMVRNDPVESFAPALDVAQMTQQYVHSRLFRS